MSGVLNSPPSVFYFQKKKIPNDSPQRNGGVPIKCWAFPNWPMGFVLVKMIIFGGTVLGVPPFKETPKSSAKTRQKVTLKASYGTWPRRTWIGSSRRWSRFGFVVVFFCWGVGKRRWNWGGGLCGWIYHKVRERVREKTSKGVRECWKYPIDIQ